MSDVQIVILEPDRSIEIQFSDGLRQIPDWIVDQIGAEELGSLKDELVNVPYEDFVQGVYQVLADKKAENMRQAIIDRHFSDPFRQQ